jgi:metallo-beta-lactamase family protein
VKNADAHLSFHGAAREVTGSCFLLEAGGRRVLIDCGLFQGGPRLPEANGLPFAFDPASVDFLLLTHAHLDHCGRIPLLVKRGFAGEIIATAATRELARIVLLDSAHLQQEEAERAARQRRRTGDGIEQPLYTLTDVLRTFDYFGREAAFDRPLSLADGLDATFTSAGHILGAASIAVDFSTAVAHRRRIVFSGDIGPRRAQFLLDPAPPPDADYVVMEATYGDRRHRDFAASVGELYDAINQTFARGGNVIIPTFALERTQDVLYQLREGAETDALPRHLNVFLDSPMAISATEVFWRHPECFKPDVATRLGRGFDPFFLPNLHFVREAAGSMALNNIDSGAVIMAGSGMCNGGRVRHHLKHNLWRRQSSIVFVGFAARGTPGRKIIDGAKSLRLFGQDVAVNAAIHTINGFSAHADREDLLAWHKACGTPRRTFLVHGEPERGLLAFAERLSHHGHRVNGPRTGARVALR